jgi:outer membrane murein-binding lipoprotein Lpp
MTGVELVRLLQDASVRDEVQRALGLPSEPVAQAIAALTLELRELARHTDERFAELAGEVKQLAGEVKQLAGEVKQLAGDMKQLAGEVKDLAEAQKRTEQEVARLARAMRMMRKHVGTLSDSLGFPLEDRARDRLPAWLRAQHGIEVAGLRRLVVRENGELLEIDLFAEGTRAGERVLVAGEAKARVSARAVEKFARQVRELCAARGAASWFGFVFGYRFASEAYVRAAQESMALIGSDEV